MASISRSSSDDKIPDVAVVSPEKKCEKAKVIVSVVLLVLGLLTAGLGGGGGSHFHKFSSSDILTSPLYPDWGINRGDPFWSCPCSHSSTKKG